MSRPILAVDVDGVIALLGHDEEDDPPGVQLQLINGMMHCISLSAGERLRRLTAHYELVWASGWERRANDHFPELPQASLPQLRWRCPLRLGALEARPP